MAPLCHRNARQSPIGLFIKQKFSPYGSVSPVSAPPTISPDSLTTGHSMTLLRPPNVPKSTTWPCSHKTACMTVSPGGFDQPVTQPRLLMLLDLAWVPPRP